MAQLRLTTVVEPPRSLDWPAPFCAGGEPLDLVGKLAATSPALGVGHLVDASINGTNGWITGADGDVQSSLTWFGDAFTSEAPQEPDVGSDQHLAGTSMSLLSDFANHNYGHLLYDCLPRFDLALRAGVQLGDVDHVLCWGPEPLRSLWAEIGVPADKIVYVQADVRYHCDTLIATSFPGVRRALAPWAAEFLRRRLQRPAEGHHRRLYLRRTTTRLLRNEGDLLATLLDRGFELLDPGLDGMATRAAFAAAEVVVSAHGAGLADLVFCPPTTHIVELIPSDHPYPYWFAAATTCGLDYRYVSCPSLERRAAGSLGPSLYDFECDPESLATAFTDILG
ncbi:MAG: glycosyltransferase 61 family protein [Actinomycetota bacterium]